MARKNDWTVAADSTTLHQVIPDAATYHYDLFNLTERECLVYGHRDWGINLRWGDPSNSNNIRFERQSGSNEPIRSGELIAINVRGGGFLIYEGRDYGINLAWSRTPRFEWKLMGASDGQPIPTGTALGLYNTVENDYLMYEERDWGINLKWLKDAGQHNRLHNAVDAGRKVVDVAGKVAPFVV